MPHVKFISLCNSVFTVTDLVLPCQKESMKQNKYTTLRKDAFFFGTQGDVFNAVPCLRGLCRYAKAVSICGTGEVEKFLYDA